MGVAAVGEVLADLVPDSEAPARYEARPGGAPANLAAQVARLGVTSRLIGRVGDDALGALITDALKSAHVLLDGFQKGPEPTAVALADTVFGQPRFRLFREDSADLYLDTHLLPPLWEETRWLAVSGVALTRPPLAATVKGLAVDAVEEGVGVALDLNWRAGLIRSREGWRRALKPVAAVAAILKGTVEELEEFRNGRSLWDTCPRLSLIMVTRGAEGLELVRRDGSLTAGPALPVTVADAIGAGDAALGTLLALMDRASVGADGIEQLDTAYLAFLARAAAAAGSLACRAAGGMAAQATTADLEQVLDADRLP